VHLSIITDEIDEDLGRALDVCEDLDVRAVELRSIGGLNVVEHPPEALEAMRAELERRGFRVCAIASAYLKCRRGEAPAVVGALHNAPARPRAAQDIVLTRAIRTARVMSAPVVRAFSFWREADPRVAIRELGEELRGAARVAAAAGLTLAVENESECNVGSTQELAAVLAEVASAELGVIWDAANAASLDPRGFDVLRDLAPIAARVVHVHAKDVDDEGRCVRIGGGLVDHTALLRALDAAGYRGYVSIETHYERDGSGEAATRECVASLRSIAAEAGVRLSP